MTLEQALGQMRSAENRWRQTLAQHRLAPPDAGFASRLADQAAACHAAHDAYAYAATIEGLAWDPLPADARLDAPYELRPDSGRRGPAELWQRFDEAIEQLNQALKGSVLGPIGDAFGALGTALDTVSQVVVEEDGHGQSAARA